MRGNIVGLLAAALMGVCGVASANIIYNVDISGSGETVTGTITTNGTLGALTAASIVAWNLSATGPIVFTVVSPGNDLCQNPLSGGCGVTAEPNGTLDFTGTSPAFLAFYGGAVQLPPEIAFFAGAVDVIPNLSGDHQQIANLSNVIGTASSAPEPPTAILLGIGLTCLGLACTRARGRHSAAV